ncbi:hypothetical protein BC830DRAFT_1111406 [Chytriomyces sp. MP71]|nr:hypothetical protein BC830DRAFT_1111406 [Chytriomyces sp. MP71]
MGRDHHRCVPLGFVGTQKLGNNQPPLWMATLQSFEIIGRGPNLRTEDRSICVEAGWGCEGRELSALALVGLSKSVRNVRIVAELRGVCETRWEYGGRLATKVESGNYKVTRNVRVFQQISETVFENKDGLAPTQDGSPLSFPFSFKLPKNQMPPSYGSPGGSVQYSMKCTMLFQEGMNLLRSSYEIDVPVQVYIPESAKINLLASPLAVTHRLDDSADKVTFSVDITSRIAAIGDCIEVNVAITKTPGKTRLRLVNAALKLVGSYVKPDRTVAFAKFPRPLDDMSQLFPLPRIGGSEGEHSIHRTIHLYVDPELAQSSIECPLISVKTVFRLEIVLDNSETPNIVYEVPIIVVPPPKDHALAEGALKPHTSRRTMMSRQSLTSTVDSVPETLVSVNSIQTLNISVLESDASSFFGLRHGDQRSLLYTPQFDSFVDDPMFMDNDAVSLHGSELSGGASSSVNGFNSIYSTHVTTWTVDMVANWVKQFGASDDVVKNFIGEFVWGDGQMLTPPQLRIQLQNNKWTVMFSYPLHQTTFKGNWE